MAPAPLRAATAEALARGRELFDAGRWFDAHEVWEDAWRVEAGEARALLQGLIHVAAACHHAFVRRRPRGAVRLLASGLELLAPLPEGLGGLELARFRTEAARALAAARRWESGEVGELDAALAPALGSARSDP